MNQNLKTFLSPFIYGKEIPSVAIAGPCSAETEEQTLATAQALAKTGIPVFRAGIWKPRTRPGCFEGVGAIGLKWLRRVKTETGMAVATEVATGLHAKMALRHGIDIIWIGARTTANPFALNEIAEILKEYPKTPVMVKNPVGPDIDAWTGAFERLRRAGIHRLAAVHRGFSHFSPSPYRNNPEWSVAFELRRRHPDLPLIVDPSHIAGKRELVGPVAQTALDLGFDGLMIESHICPDCAWSDKQQQLTPDQLADLCAKLKIREDDALSRELDILRDHIDLIDNGLIDLLRQRMEAAENIGIYKRHHEMPVLQEGRYRDLMEKRIAQSTALGLSETFMRRLFQTIHAESVRLQLLNDNECDGVQS